MKILFMLFILMLMVTFQIECDAQNILTDTIKWTSEMSEELKSQTQISSVTTITTAGTFIQFERENDSFQFIVNETEGIWPDLSIEGTLRYEVSYQDRPGTIILERTGNLVYIEIDFTESSEDAMHQKIIVNNYQVVNK